MAVAELGMYHTHFKNATEGTTPAITPTVGHGGPSKTRSGTLTFDYQTELHQQGTPGGAGLSRHAEQPMDTLMGDPPRRKNILRRLARVCIRAEKGRKRQPSRRAPMNPPAPAI